MIKSRDFDWSKNGTFGTAEASDFQDDFSPSVRIQIFGKDGKPVYFRLYKIDKDNEETHGWRYRSEDNKYEILIIND